MSAKQKPHYQFSLITARVRQQTQLPSSRSLWMSALRWSADGHTCPTTSWQECKAHLLHPMCKQGLRYDDRPWQLSVVNKVSRKRYRRPLGCLQSGVFKRSGQLCLHACRDTNMSSLTGDTRRHGAAISSRSMNLVVK